MPEIIFGSSTMNTEYVAQRLANALGGAALHNVRDISIDLIMESSRFVLISSTWGAGDLQDDWEAFFPAMEQIDLSGKTFGLVGVGDQDNYPDAFCDGIALLYDLIIKNGGTVVGPTPVEGYAFTSSRAIRAGKFVGLILDEDNQASMSDERIREWVRTTSAALS